MSSGLPSGALSWLSVRLGVATGGAGGSLRLHPDRLVSATAAQTASATVLFRGRKFIGNRVRCSSGRNNSEGLRAPIILCCRILRNRLDFPAFAPVGRCRSFGGQARVRSGRALSELRRASP